MIRWSAKFPNLERKMFRVNKDPDYIKSIVLILSAFIFLSACIGPSGSKVSFPTGTLTAPKHPGIKLAFNEKGTFTIMNGDEIISTGLYSVTGNEIQIGPDTFCTPQGKGTGTYVWRVQYGRLIFRVKGKDPCLQRKFFLEQYRWLTDR